MAPRAASGCPRQETGGRSRRSQSRGSNKRAKAQTVWWWGRHSWERWGGGGCAPGIAGGGKACRNLPSPRFEVACRPSLWQEPPREFPDSAHRLIQVDISGSLLRTDAAPPAARWQLQNAEKYASHKACESAFSPLLPSFALLSLYDKLQDPSTFQKVPQHHLSGRSGIGALGTPS